MVHSRVSPLDHTFFALSNPTRRAMLARLADRDMSVHELAEPFELSPAAISKHLGVLKEAGLLKQRRAGMGRECSLQPAPLQDAVNWLEKHRHLWTQQLDSFANYTEQLSKQPKKGKRRT